MTTTFTGRSDDEFIVRSLRESDYEIGFLECLGNLTEVGKVTFDQFKAQHALREKQGYFTVVIEDIQKKTIIGSGSIIFENKFTRSCGLVGHIEDIVVDKSYRGKRLGLRVVDALQEEACRRQCYKVILDCSEENKTFYEKLGFVEKELQMRYNVSQSGDDYKKNSRFVDQSATK